MLLVYIHGAGASGESFNYIREHVHAGDDIVFEYSSKDGFAHNLELMQRQLEDMEQIFFVAHSLGGVYALHLAARMPTQVLGAVTMATPYGGSKSADYAKYFLPFSRLLRDIGPNSKPIRDANKIKVQHPWLNIVTTRGECPWIVEPNDGVVTIASQRHRKDIEYVELQRNHYEVVVCPHTVKIITDRITANDNTDPTGQPENKTTATKKRWSRFAPGS
jgi:pimeloyl-ACP methyl ester carboxylesterase